MAANNNNCFNKYFLLSKKVVAPFYETHEKKECFFKYVKHPLNCKNKHVKTSFWEKFLASSSCSALAKVFRTIVSKVSANRWRAVSHNILAAFSPFLQYICLYVWVCMYLFVRSCLKAC